MIAVELRKLVSSKRTWATILLIDALPTLVGILLAVTDLGPRPGTGPAFLSAVLTDGTLFPLAALGIVLPLFLPIAVAVTAGEAIAGEAQQGTLRYLLIRPVGRTRLLVAKLVSVMAFVVLTVLVVAATAYVVGALFLGSESVTSSTTTSVSGSGLSQQELIARTFLALGYAMLCMLGVAAIALFLSTVVRSPLAAALGTLAVLVASTLLLTLDAANVLQPYLPDPLLAGLRRPLPRPDPLARRGPRRAAPGGVRRGVPRCGLGQLHDQGHHRLTDLAVRSGRLGAPELRDDHRDDRWRAGHVGVADGQVGADVLHGEGGRAVEDAGVGRHDGLVVAGPDRHPARTGRCLVARVEPTEQVAVGRELLARRGARGRTETAGDRGQIRPVVGRGERHDPAGDGVAAEVGDPDPGHDPAGRVADDVDRRQRPCRPRSDRSAAAWSRRSPVPSPGGSKTTTSRPSARSASASTSSDAVDPPYPGTSTTGPSSSCATGSTLSGRDTTTATTARYDADNEQRADREHEPAPRRGEPVEHGHPALMSERSLIAV